MRSFAEEADLSAAVGAKLRKAAGVPEDVADAAGWGELWKNSGATKVYCIRGSGGARAHVVVSFVTPLALVAMKDPELVQSLQRMGIDPVTMSGAEYGRMIDEGYVQMGKALKETGLLSQQAK